MKKITSFYEKNKWLCIAAGMSLLPLICCILYCAVHGYAIADVYLPADEWNDELFYFKQVESILHYGYPRGYFGFNESHAMKLSFAAWSPVLVFPWIVWGFLLGWNLLSPVLCNIVLMMAAVFFFVWLARPEKRQLCTLSVLFVLFTPFTRYMLSGMPECSCFALLIVFYGLAYSWIYRQESRTKLVLMILLSALMTLMRPYLGLFLLLPLALWIWKSRSLKSVLGSIAVLGITVGCYAALNYYFSAEYFEPLFYTDWVTNFFEKGFLPGCKYVFGTLYYEGRAFFARVVEGFRSGLAEGAFFAVYCAAAILFLIQAVRAFRHKDRKRLLLSGHMFFSYVAMLAALLLMYNMKDGSKHLLTFIAAGIFLISLMKEKGIAYYRKAAVLGALFCYLLIFRADSSYDYEVPFIRKDVKEEMQYWEDRFTQEMKLKEGKPSYDNVIIWIFSDRLEATGEQKLGEWQILYGIPEGFGISCCYADYTVEHFETLKSKYLLAVPDGKIEELCKQAGYLSIGRTENAVVYKRY